MPPSPAPFPSRRAVLAGGVAVLVTGCSVNNPLSDTKTPAAEAVRELAPDVAVAVEAVTLVKTAAAVLEATARAHPALTRRLDGLRGLHAAHLAAVQDAVPDRVDTSATATSAPVPPRPGVALAQLLAGEGTLHDRLVALALRAESGQFARLLGSMAAGISQQLAVLR